MYNQVSRNKSSKYYADKRRALLTPPSSYAINSGAYQGITWQEASASPHLNLEPDNQTLTALESGTYAISWSIIVNGDPALNTIETLLEIDQVASSSLGFASMTFAQNGRGFYGVSSSTVVHLDAEQSFAIKAFLSTTANIRSALGTGDTQTESKLNIIKIA